MFKKQQRNRALGLWPSEELTKHSQSSPKTGGGGATPPDISTAAVMAGAKSARKGLLSAV